jgi:capsular polysaccharide biosynthesis protein
MLYLLREAVLRAIPGAFKESDIQSTYWNRVGTGRSAVNSNRILAVVRKAGLEIQNPAELTFQEQVTSIRKSRVLVTGGGAAMSNFIFAREGTEIIVLVSDMGREFAMPHVLAAVSNSRVTTVGGRSFGLKTKSNLVEMLHADYETNISELREGLRRVV